MLLQSLGHLKGLFYDEGVIIDDPVFKLHYGFTTLILLFASILGECFDNNINFNLKLNITTWLYKSNKLTLFNLI